MRDPLKPAIVLKFTSLDQELFAELERDPGIYGIEAWIVRTHEDPRLSLPDDVPFTVLVSSTLLAGQLPESAVWHVLLTRLKLDGNPHLIDIGLIEDEPFEDNSVPIDPDPTMVLPPGTVFRRLFHIDLRPLWVMDLLHGGDRLTISYGPAYTQVVVP